MRYVFLSAFRNESAIIEAFLAEFVAMARAAGILDRTVLYLVDDLSFDDSTARIERFVQGEPALTLRTLRVPTNLGNQGAMFFGLSRVDVGPDDVLVTFDCDGEDDVKEIPSILELGAANPGRVVLIERGRRAESLVFKLCFAGYRLLFRFLTQRRVVPNNFMLIPGRHLPAIRSTTLAAVHLAYGILRLNPPHVVVTRDRRPRYGGQTSQNLFMLMSHGLVGLMVFAEVVVSKIFVLASVLGAAEMAIVFLGLALGPGQETAQRALLGIGAAAAIGAGTLLALLLAAALALAFKLAMFRSSVGPGPDDPRG